MTTTTTTVRAAAKSARVSVVSCRRCQRSHKPSVRRCPRANRTLGGRSCGPVEHAGQSSWTRTRAARAAKSARATARLRRPPSRGNSPWTLPPSSVRSHEGSLYYRADCFAAVPASLCHAVLNAMAVDDYRKNHWPELEKAIDRLLIQNSTDHIAVSYAQIYGYIYKCVCQQHSELLYNDLKSKISSHLQQVSAQLQDSPPESFIENFNTALTQYTASLQCIVPVFMYLNKFYIESKLNRDLGEDLMKLFADHVAEKHVKVLMPLLIKAHSMPFQVQPSTMASVVKGLYSLRPEWAQLAPALFSGFIPQINPPAVESLLSDYAAHDQKLQMELSMNGFPRGDQSRKRASDDS
ncbi:CDK2-associated and cullin domain-containing protein 1 isoform X1 [Betta splendens]|uniref:CDK2-associated and cullin domain-containing protein 1 isoform X1 n=1 Tax=Betta splendens TaxID=158456 RepID=A0A6P7PUV1_BETSP|nr:CDK2-associated and cullin domain-containing protein 1 isoform X1 [Betta splendens]